MSSPPDNFTSGSLYLVGLAQARAPHVGVLLAEDPAKGFMVHIRINRDESPNWTYQGRQQAISGDMFVSTLLKIHDVSDGVITKNQLENTAKTIAVPQNDEFGECLPWALRVVESLNALGLVALKDDGVAALEHEFTEFAAGNRSYATRTRFPNVKISSICS